MFIRTPCAFLCVADVAAVVPRSYLIIWKILRIYWMKKHLNIGMCGSYVCMNGLPHRTKAKTNSLVCSDTTTFCVFFKSTECLHTRVYLSTMYLCTTHNGMAERFAFTKCIFNNLLLKANQLNFCGFYFVYDWFEFVCFACLLFQYSISVFSALLFKWILRFRCVLI